MATPYHKSRWETIDPTWLFIGIIAILASISEILLILSNVHDFLTGLLAGVWLCIICGFALYLYRRHKHENH